MASAHMADRAGIFVGSWVSEISNVADSISKDLEEVCIERIAIRGNWN